LTSHRFVLCPPGNGTDTHRLWEALYSRTIPVALDAPAMAAFRDLPILFVEDFRKLTRDFLAGEYERIRTSRWNWPKLFLPWWRDRIAEQCDKLKRAGAGKVPRRRCRAEQVCPRDRRSAAHRAQAPAFAPSMKISISSPDGLGDFVLRIPFF